MTSDITVERVSSHASLHKMVVKLEWIINGLPCDKISIALESIRVECYVRLRLTDLDEYYKIKH